MISSHIVNTFVTEFGFILRYIHRNVISWKNDLENSVTGDFSVKILILSKIVLPDTSQLIAPAGAQEVILSVRVCVSSLLKLYALSQQALSQLLELKILGLVF